jgi:hypothetical protein
MAATGRPGSLPVSGNAEKPTGNGAPYGVTEAGEQDPESLIVDGWTRAGALVELFDPRTSQGSPAPLRPGLTRPVNVVAANPGSSGSKRPEETVTPLAAALGTSIDLKYEEGDEAAMVASLSSLSGPTLVCWEHTEIPTIISHLGQVTPPPPTSWPSAVFDVVFVFTRSGTGWNFTQVLQELLPVTRPRRFPDRARAHNGVRRVKMAQLRPDGWPIHQNYVMTAHQAEHEDLGCLIKPKR